MTAASTGIIVGASGGIGRACLERLAASVQRIVAVARTPMSYSEAGVTVCPADISLESGRRSIVETTAAVGLPIRFLVLASGTPHRQPITRTTESEWDALLRSNVSGPALLIGKLLDLEWTEPASIVVIGSLSARRALPDRAAYGASKAALEQFSLCAAIELAPRRISVNVVNAGVVDTPFVAADSVRLDDYVARRVPVGRMAKAVEIADVVGYLVSAPEFMTGSTIEVDGGASVAG